MEENRDRPVRLPEAEFDVINVIWKYDRPVTTTDIMNDLGYERGWKLPTLVSLLLRLEERHFISSEKNGKMRYYTSLVRREDYLEMSDSEYIKRYHASSIADFLRSLYRNRKLSNEDISALYDWLKTKFN